MVALFSKSEDVHCHLTDVTFFLMVQISSRVSPTDRNFMIDSEVETGKIE